MKGSDEMAFNTYTVNAGIGLRLRASASLSGDKILLMPTNSFVEAISAEEVTSDGYLWRNVKYQSTTGWCATKYLTIKDDNEGGKTTDGNYGKGITLTRIDNDVDNTEDMKVELTTRYKQFEYVDYEKMYADRYKRSEFEFRNSLSIIGSPPQYLDNVDPKLNENDQYGRIYSEKFLTKAPISVIIPGLPAFLNQVDSDAKVGIMGNVKGLEEKTNDKVQNISEMLNGVDAKLYEFQTQYPDYVKRLSSVCRLASHYLDIADEPIYGMDKTTYSSFDWDFAKMGGNGWQDLFGLESALTVYFNPNSGLSDGFSNSTGESAMFGTLNGVSDQVNEAKFFFGASGMDITADDEKSYQQSVDDLSKMIEDNDANLIGRLFSRGSTAFETTKQGGKLLLPEIWKTSDYKKTYALDVSLKCVDGSRESLMLHVIYPLLALVCLAAPRQLGTNGYLAPYIIQGHAKGFWNCEIGMIDSLSIKRNPASRTIDGIPTEVDVSVTIRDLYPTMSVGYDKGSAAASFFNNSGLIDFVGTMTGLNLNKPDFRRKLDAYISSKTNIVRDIPGNVERNIISSIRDTSRRLFGDL